MGQQIGKSWCSCLPHSCPALRPRTRHTCAAPAFPPASCLVNLSPPAHTLSTHTHTRTCAGSGSSAPRLPPASCPAPASSPSALGPSPHTPTHSHTLPHTSTPGLRGLRTSIVIYTPTHIQPSNLRSEDSEHKFQSTYLCRIWFMSVSASCSRLPCTSTNILCPHLVHTLP